MLDQIRSSIPTKWNKNDQLVIFGISALNKKGFAIILDSRYSFWKRGLRSIKNRATEILSHYATPGPTVCKYVGSDQVPGQPGQYHFVYCNVGHVLHNSIEFDFDDDLRIGPFGPVRTSFIRCELIRRGHIKIDSSQAA